MPTSSAGAYPVDPERTIFFRIASVSKVFTATAAMQLVEQGQIALDVDVNRYLERFQIEPAFGAPVTLFHLLTHTAGFDDRNVARKARTPADMESLGSYLARRMPDRLWPPGRFIFSAAGTDLFSAAVGSTQHAENRSVPALPSTENKSVPASVRARLSARSCALLLSRAS